MRKYLINKLAKGNSERDSIARYEIGNAKFECVQLAYQAAKNNASDLKLIYLLGGNPPDKCPFK
jgi:hypothetical protein